MRNNILAEHPIPGYNGPSARAIRAVAGSKSVRRFGGTRDGLMIGKTESSDQDFGVKRDMELIRKILLLIEAKEDLDYRALQIDGVDPIVLGRHMEMLYQNGFVEGLETTVLNEPCSHIQVRDLSWEGHEFLANISREEVWNKLKESFGPGGMSSLSWDVLKDVAKAAALDWAKKKLGLS